MASNQPTTSRQFSMFLTGVLWTANALRRSSWMERRRKVMVWRTASAITAMRLHIPHLECVAAIVATPVQPKGRLADAGAHEPVVKAVVDGLVDAGVMSDDDPAHLKTLIYHAPVRSYDDITDLGVAITIVEAVSDASATDTALRVALSV